MPKTRLDVLLVERGFVTSREKAKALIMAGDVFINGQREDKPGTSFQEDKIKNIEVRGAAIPFVSRGGLKLDKAVKTFGLDFTGFTCMDIGASTGGFTDCMLQNGASKVYSVDVGHGQLDWKLRSDDRVVCMEKTNFRHLTRDQIDDDIDFASCDVSFISLDKILVPARKLLKDGAQMVVLIKPQFEAGRDKVGKKGVVRDKKVHEEVISRIMDFADFVGFEILHLDYSPIRGPEGNIEYLLHLSKDASRNDEVSGYDEETALKKFRELEESGSGISETIDNKALIKKAVEAAHGELEG
ncbi:23S rRNA (cytidine1920-2'-O)/16S rRNA (cytidine1409-2'-O)-methyltransferase [Butyrivibrio fibrisolvens DSM 3071]|uniref:23S rRNA (Cytidine1920-2'-O)/16S rRNA (Cytidine1409-2'-O)-methyltransferase n=1 Tax=Butyrivibrio fibrisolvens DSM 3071 TaxID=1121131 RepID=A0A1M6CFI0_BUTFI|nr:TlyA family RNA methyltransferase [Butyrivibrio fibrisolvens]SHI59779.1 23S rRNA (cytidine1920-2'-O)/16S rRNA (cytidine1409-2'-O)-methyltransferase [Butyrivibrio fibrisolvens DSM 3071]